MKSPFKNISLRLQILKVNIKIHFIRFKTFLNILKMLSISLKMKWNIVKMKMKKVYVNAYFTIVPPLKFIFIFPAIVLSGIVVLPIIISNLVGYGDFFQRMVSPETPKEEKLAFWELTYSFLIHLSFTIYIIIAAYYVYQINYR
jgi:hypothetical protein